MRRWWGPLAAALIAATVPVLMVACGTENQTLAPAVRGIRIGNVGLGRQVIAEKGCGSCHTIPGVRGADGLVGPPLTKMGRRSFIAGRLANTPENLVRWVMNPQSVDPETAMPNLGLTEDEARNVAAYLASLD